MTTPTINIVSSADHNFVRPLAAMLQSLRDSHHGIPLSISVISDSIDEFDQQRLSEIAEIDWITPPPDLGLGVELPQYLSIASVWRLAIAEMLPDDMDRVVYLDADVLVRHPLTRIWDNQLGSNPIGAVRDPLIPWFGSRDLPWEELGLSPETPYFNSGVMLVDLEAWRRDDVGSRAQEILRTRKLPYADQCALNVALDGNWRRLSPGWNLQAGHLNQRGTTATIEPINEMRTASQHPSVIHFNNSSMGRPWSPFCTHPLAHEWFATLDRTSWSGWRPPPPRPRARVGRFYSRAARAMSALTAKSEPRISS